MHENAQLIERFYQGFQRRDPAAMLACYHPEVTFSDPVFVGLDSAQARAMWQMLVERGKDLVVTFADVQADATRGSAHWEARYTFAGRPVHNVIDASFELEGGLIRRHRDVFDLWRWAGMAMGPAGKLLGWLPPLQGAIRKKARAGLTSYMARSR